MRVYWIAVFVLVAIILVGSVLYADLAQKHETVTKHLVENSNLYRESQEEVAEWKQKHDWAVEFSKRGLADRQEIGESIQEKKQQIYEDNQRTV